MSFHSNRMVSPGESRKRKEREPYPAFYSPKPSISSARPHHQLHHTPQPPQTSNVLLAGYLAYEFLSRGTILGEKFTPERAESVFESGGRSNITGKSAVATEEKEKEEEERKYVEVASLMKTKGAHIPGIVNPTQLAQWIKM